MSDQQNPEKQESQEVPKIHVDDDWKTEARREKERLAEVGKTKEEQKAREESGQGEAKDTAGMGGEQMPPADFQTLVTTMMTQAAFAMGAIPDPSTGKRVAHLDLARHHINMLGVLEEKTKGNLSEDEEKLLSTSLYELRMQYVQLSQQAVAQGVAGAIQNGKGGGENAQA